MTARSDGSLLNEPGSAVMCRDSRVALAGRRNGAGPYRPARRLLPPGQGFDHNHPIGVQYAVVAIR